jgi:peptidoglycan hydrolase-like protein with peptidoglycan-binding domain
MTLQSQLFRDDPKLEAAATSDSAHVAPGAMGPHVSKIQLALTEIDGAKIVVDSSYGSKTAAAVLAFKRKRNIVNRSYETAPDNVVGKMTIVALDKEVALFERRRDSFPICHCRDFPHASGPAVGTKSQLAFGIPARPAGAVSTPSAKVQALRRVPGAINWVAQAREFIRIGTAQVLSGLPLDEFRDSEVRKALVTHFKINEIPSPIGHLNFLDDIYELINQVLNFASTIFQDDPRTGDYGNAFLGGFYHRSDRLLGKIRFGPNYRDKGELFQTAVLVHEGAHFVNATIDHFASELPPPDGTPVNSSTGPAHTKNYTQLNFQEASENAYTYAQFALHAFKGFDKRIVPFDE